MDRKKRKAKIIITSIAIALMALAPIVCNIILWTVDTPPVAFAYCTGLLTVTGIWGMSEKVVALCMLIFNKPAAAPSVPATPKETIHAEVVDIDQDINY